jgi:alkanesulfonate monooxygenase SsuD/methylene tetrahydromethanopterin reductase-like flavin-dependent oxidoreductase (luciferase family)
VVHHGKYFDVEGIHLAEPSVQRTPVLFQAGSSGRGQRFAARHAECVFIAATSRGRGAALGDARLREAVVQAGRRPDDVKVFMAASVDRRADDRRGARPGRPTTATMRAARPASRTSPPAPASTSASYGLDEPIDYTPGNAIQSHARAAQEHGWTRRKMLEMFDARQPLPGHRRRRRAGGRQLQSWVAETGVDGFNLSRTVVPECHEAFVDLVVPELQQRGAYKTAYDEGTCATSCTARATACPLATPRSAFRRRVD